VFSELRAHLKGCKRISSTMDRITLFYFETAEEAESALEVLKTEGYGDLKMPNVCMLSDKRSFKDLSKMQMDKQILQVMGIPVGMTWKSLKPCFPGAARIVINRDMIRHGIAQVIYNNEQVASQQFDVGTVEVEGGLVVRLVYSPYRAFRNERFLFKDGDNDENILDPRITFDPPRRFWRRRNNRRSDGNFRGRPRGYRMRRNRSAGDSESNQDNAKKPSQPTYSDFRQDVLDLKSDLEMLRSTVGSLAKSLKATQLAE